MVEDSVLHLVRRVEQDGLGLYRGIGSSGGGGDDDDDDGCETSNRAGFVTWLLQLPPSWYSNTTGNRARIDAHDRGRDGPGNINRVRPPFSLVLTDG